MDHHRDEQRNFFDYLTRIASLYYLEGKTQAEVAGSMGISRQKVQRLLRQARDLGIVEINIRNLNSASLSLEKKLKNQLKLREVIIAASGHTEVKRRQLVARAASDYLERHLTGGVMVTVGMGRNTGEIPNFFHPARAIDCTFISAMGSSSYAGESINPNTICQKLAANCGGSAILLHAPAYVESKKVRDILIAQQAVGPILKRSQKADVAIIGIGTPTEDATLVRMDCVSRRETQRIRESGAVGDLLGVYFDEQGRMIAPELNEHLVGLTLTDLRAIPTVIAVASEKGKARAILGAVRTGVIHILVIESENAEEILRLID